MYPMHVYTCASLMCMACALHVQVDYAGEHVACNAVAPGKIVKEPTRAVAAYSYQRTPCPQLGTPADVAAAVCFLASDEAAFITGVTLPVDGGASVRRG